MTFDEFFREHRLTAAERTDLVYFLAAMRMRKTLERLLSTPAALHGSEDGA